MKYLKLFIRETLSEGAREETSNLCVITFDLGPRRCAIVYDGTALSKIPRRLALMEMNREELRGHICNKAIKGFIDVGPHKEEQGCHGAWMVHRSAGPGYGKIIYSLGYALSPTGRLMPDRRGVSPSAQNAWTNLKNNSAYTPLTLDDAAAHNPDGSIKYSHPHHTDTPEDDCTVYDNKPHLNYAYQGTGGEMALLSSMQMNNTLTLQRLFPTREAEAEQLIKSCAAPFFNRHYKG